MPVLEYDKLSHSELSALPRDRTVVFISAGPLEEHGPHLPLGVDAYSAAYFSRRMAEDLSRKRADWNFILFPTLFAGCDTLTYPGSIEIKPWILRAMLYENCKQLARNGFRTQIAVGAHGGPRHMVVLEEVAAKMRWRHRTRMISASSRILFDILEGRFAEKLAKKLEEQGSPLSDEAKVALKTDYHGGLIETSLMMVAKPDLVHPMFKELKPAILNNVWKMRRNSGKKIGEGLGHLGSPAFARPEIGKAVADVLVADLTPNIERFLDGQNVNKLFRSKFYYIPFFRTDFKILTLFVVYMMALAMGVGLFNRIFVEMYK